MSGEEEHEAVGSLGEEAAKLLAALQGWAKEDGSEYAAAAAGAANSAATSLNAINEHIATGSGDCRYCPLCQVISAVRQTSPEVKQHLSSAATSLLQAAAGLLSAHVPDESNRRRDSGVERINLSDGDEWED